MTVYIELNSPPTTKRDIDAVTINALVHIMKIICDMNPLISVILNKHSFYSLMSKN